MESAEARQLRETAARGRISLAVFSAFVGLVLGLLTPVFVFGQRLAVQEERMSVVMDGIASINKKVDATNEGMTNLRVELARRGIPVRKETP